MRPVRVKDAVKMRSVTRLRFRERACAIGEDWGSDRGSVSEGSAGVTLGTQNCSKTAKRERGGWKRFEHSSGKPELCAYSVFAKARAISSRTSLKECKQSDVPVRER